MRDGFLDAFGLGAKARAYIVLRGNVYEGAYHRFTELTVRKLGLQGWMRVVSRDMDSYIEVEVEGTRYRILRILEELKKGPATAKIFGAEVQWKTFKRLYNDFRLRN